ncbi:MAG: hypothetical protein OXG33_04395 [Chloroflexi bacterium]|nr:hypothetical protein [Chloroflexota bacterium]
MSLGAQSPSHGRLSFPGYFLDKANDAGADSFTITADDRYVLGLGVRDQTIDLLA